MAFYPQNGAVSPAGSPTLQKAPQNGMPVLNHRYPLHFPDMWSFFFVRLPIFLHPYPQGRTGCRTALTLPAYFHSLRSGYVRKIPYRSLILHHQRKHRHIRRSGKPTGTIPDFCDMLPFRWFHHLAERFTRIIAPASACRIPGDNGTHRSSQISTAKLISPPMQKI